MSESGVTRSAKVLLGLQFLRYWSVLPMFSEIHFSIWVIGVTVAIRLPLNLGKMGLAKFMFITTVFILLLPIVITVLLVGDRIMGKITKLTLSSRITFSLLAAMSMK